MMLGDLEDKYFLKAVHDFVKNTREVYPGTNPIAIIRENALRLVPALPKPKRTNEELKQIADMQEFYDRKKAEVESLFREKANEKDMNKAIPKHRSPAECIDILKSRGQI